ncbi:hypothetical protein GCM10007301_15480 [Azorhizobium oxalatiphilum]|uniref:DUF2635 domain-containing protein n=1 Tax=Azorhizobium oxalatiphilum TaxID=980631 RepID=A0A917BS54_9HYPH|nr:hypothetical protein [Azorhizobium oxalatiphilum]GGF56697.1 hypothetical protein GCM10007301_15480 [Azorhizobium oxalatiphilum]
MKFRAKPGLRIPMPDRSGQFVPDTGEGTSVDELNPYYARLIADRDMVPATDETAEADPETTAPDTGSDEGEN